MVLGPGGDRLLRGGCRPEPALSMAGELVPWAIGAPVGKEVLDARLLGFVCSASAMGTVRGALFKTGVSDGVGSGLGFSGVASRKDPPAGEAFILLEEGARFLWRLELRSWLKVSAWDMLLVVEGWRFLGWCAEGREKIGLCEGQEEREAGSG